MTMQIAITRSVSPAFANCELTYLPRTPIDLALAAQQHHAYEAALRALGCQVVSLPADPGLPDSVFVEDPAVVLDGLAVIARPGAAARRPECATIAKALEVYRPLAYIQPPGTLEGGDVLLVGMKILVGLSGRSNLEGIRQLAAIVAPYGYSVKGVSLRGCLHLKSALTVIGEELLLINPNWVEREEIEDGILEENPAFKTNLDFVEVDQSEPHAANALRIGNGLIYPVNFERTRERIERLGCQVLSVDVSEIQKAEGAVTCCSLLIAL